MTGKEPILDRKGLQAERKKIITNLVLLLAASFVVLLAVGTMAWFRSNKLLESNGVMVSMVVPESIQISLGRTNGTAENQIFPNDTESLLVMSGDAVTAPRNNEPDGSDIYDWTQYLEVSDYYEFGKLFPASSVSGEYVIFTPDGAASGRELQTTARFFRADGYTDGELTFAAKGRVSEDQDSLKATSHVFQAVGEKTTDDFGGNYVRSNSWYDTNDDGYYVDLPVWFRTDHKDQDGVKLLAEGYITKKDDEIVDDDEYALYKAVRVAILKETDAGSLVAAAGQTANLIPLKNAKEFGSAGASIMDSENYTVSRGGDTEHPEALYGLKLTDENGIVQGEDYQAYSAYAGEAPVIELEASSGEGWSEARKYWIRIWLDGDDRDCFNATAGQDWKIFLRFFKISQE